MAQGPGKRYKAVGDTDPPQVMGLEVVGCMVYVAHRDGRVRSWNLKVNC